MEDDFTTDDVLDEIQSDVAHYVGVARWHAVTEAEGRGALFASVAPEDEGPPGEGVFTFYLPRGAARDFLSAQGGAWLRWFKGEVRPALLDYNPETEAVVLTVHEDGPRCTIIRSDEPQTDLGLPSVKAN
jgi:hypothetical protein